MYGLQAENSFDAAHFLPGYPGKCKNIHGHRWRVVAEIFGDALEARGGTAGMLTDFSDLKRDLRDITDPLDHALLLEIGSLRPETKRALELEEFRMVELPFRTTAENFSRYFYQQLTSLGYRVREVRVYETPTNCAIYTEETGVR